MKHGQRCAVLVILIATAFSAAGGPPDPRIDAIIDRMPPRERIGQLLLVGFSGTTANDEVRRLVSEWKVGALAIYARNVNSAAQLATLTAAIRALPHGEVSPLLAIDQEGGEVTRIAEGVPQLPGAMALGATRSPDLARKAGRALAVRLAALGVSWNLAPVIDLASPESPIGIRAFAHDPRLTASLAAAFVAGEKEGGIASTVKHFPGIGTAAVDSHDEMPQLHDSLEDLRRGPFVPFRATIDAGTDAVMFGHAAVPALDGTTPAVLSPRIHSLLRDELHFDGIAITDALEMRALDRRQGIGRLAVQAIAAGADMVIVLWHDRDREEVRASLEAAYRTGELPDGRVREALRRILKVKLRLRPQRAATFDDRIAGDIAARSLTLLRNAPGLVPLRTKVAFYVGPSGPIAAAVRAPTSLDLPTYIASDGFAFWSARARDGAVHTVGDGVIVGVAQNEAQLAVIRAAHEARPTAPLLLISLGSPQLIRGIPDAAAYVCAYGYLTPSQNAVAALLAGRIAPEGRLPVDVPTFFHEGDGLAISKGDAP